MAFATWSLYDLIESPSWENAGWFALDLAALIIPFLPGGSKVITKADDLIDATGFVSKYDEVIVLGQSMKKRVTPYANKIGASIYGGLDSFDDIKKAYGTVTATLVGYFDNMAYIMNHSIAGAKFIDIGFDLSRTIKGKKGLALFSEIMSLITIFSEKLLAQLFREKNLYRLLVRCFF